LGSVTATTHVFFLVTLTGHRLRFLPRDARGTARHGEPLPVSPMIHDFKQRTNPHTMTGGASASGTSDALGIGPSSGYTRNSSFILFIICVLSITIGMSWLHILALVNNTHMHIYVITNLLLFFWIKMTWKMPKFLTAQPTSSRSQRSSTEPR
jgi:hypothetical protein